MKNASIKKFITWLCLGLYLLIGVISLNNVAFCLGADNHIGFKFAGVESCCKPKNNTFNDTLSYNSSNIQTQFGLYTADNQCGNCIDTKIVINTPDQSDRVIDSVIKYIALKPTGFSFNISDFLYAMPTKVVIENNNNTGKTLGILKTVILII